MVVLVPVIVLLLIMKKVPAPPALFAGIISDFAIIFQPHLIIELSGIDSNFFQASYVSIINAMGSETSINTSNEMINDLLSSGGMYGMLNTIWLIICAMCFGGVMEASGALKRLANPSYSMLKVQAHHCNYCLYLFIF